MKDKIQYDQRLGIAFPYEIFEIAEKKDCVFETPASRNYESRPS